jgi:hypothetical protein
MNADHLTMLRDAVIIRCNRLREIDDELIFTRMLVRFWQFLKGNQIIWSELQELLKSESAISTAKMICQQHSSEAIDEHFAKDERQHLETMANVLRIVAETDSSSLQPVFYNVCYGFFSANSTATCEHFKTQVIQSLADYLCERLSQQQAIFGTLLRYKWRSEFYNRDELSKIAEDTNTNAKADEVEKRLKGDLNRYLHDQGIDFIIDPKLERGMIDYFVQANAAEKLVLIEGKVHDGGGRNKAKVIQGIDQAYEYAKQYQYPRVYYVVYNTAERELRFALNEEKISNAIQPISAPGVRIFALVVDVCMHGTPVSKRQQNPNDITEQDIIHLTGKC